MARQSAYKSVSTHYTVADAVSEAYSELQCLRDEMRDWQSNMEGTGLESTEKYGEVETAADALDSVADDEPDVPEAAGDLDCEVTIMQNRRKGRGNSRAVRKDNAGSMLEAAIAAIEAEMDRLEDVVQEADGTIQEAEDMADDLTGDAEERDTANPPDDEEAEAFREEAAEMVEQATGARTRKEEAETAKDELEELKDALQNTFDEIDGIDFPGMY